MQKKRWTYQELPENPIERLCREADISRLLAKVLVSRGMEDPEQVRGFLYPSLDDLHDPYLLNDMEEAVDRLERAVVAREPITIYGDYDVDGVTSTTVLYRFLSSLGAEVGFYIPDRLEEGYGLSREAIDKLHAAGTRLMVTVDCGITAVDEVSHAKFCGLDVIVTDHHECREILPEADAVVNPCRPDSTYPFRELAGVGVAFKLVHALCMRMGKGEAYLEYLDLVSLGTVADVVPLIGENRIIVKYGLPIIEKTTIPGLQALIEVAGLKDKPLTSFGVSFGLAPRINAAGRIGDAGRAVRMLLTEEPGEAARIAAELNDENRYRQESEQEILQQAVSLVETQVDLQREKVIVVAGEGWHHGIIGIVASKITERFYRPSVLISIENGEGKGSGRSIEGFNLFEALQHCGAYLDRFGGHEQAAGLALKTENLVEFRHAINEYAERVLTEQELIPKVNIDVRIDKADIHVDSVRDLELLAPFGAGNHGPVFAYDDLKINEIRTVGDQKHLKLRLGTGNLQVDAIGFQMGELASSYSLSDTVDAAFSLEVNVWNGSRKVQMNLKDIRPNEGRLKEIDYFYALDKAIVFDPASGYNRDKPVPDQVLERLKLRRPEEIIPERMDLVVVYQYFRGGPGSVAVEDLAVLATTIGDKARVCMNYFKLKKCIEIFEELNLLKQEPMGEKGMKITLVSGVKEKTDLEKSLLYRKLQKLKEASIWT